jgi:hypothetical protein
MLQRKLRLSWADAEKYMTWLEMVRAVGPANGSQPREVLVRPEDLDAFLQHLTGGGTLPPKFGEQARTAQTVDELEELFAMDAHDRDRAGGEPPNGDDGDDEALDSEGQEDEEAVEAGPEVDPSLPEDTRQLLSAIAMSDLIDLGPDAPEFTRTVDVLVIAVKVLGWEHNSHSARRVSQAMREVNVVKVEPRPRLNVDGQMKKAEAYRTADLKAAVEANTNGQY